MVREVVSVILPVYNQGETLNEAIDSVLSQDYKTLELIILNDGSTDHSEEVITSYRDSRIIYRKLGHAGLPGALNEGLRLARGEFVSWTSGDNILLQMMLSELVAALKQRPQYVAAYSGYYHIDETGKIIGQNLKAPYIYTPERFTQRRNRDYLVTQYCNFGASFLYRTSACRRVGEYDQECEGAEDLDYSIRIAKIGRVHHVPKLLYMYRLHSNSMTGKEREKKVSFKSGKERVWEKIINREYDKV